MAKQCNPLREWRWNRMMTTANAARELGLLPETYRTLEYLPSKLSITTDTILHIASITHIPLEVLVDYLESNHAPA